MYPSYDYPSYDTKINQYSPNKDIHFQYGHSILHFPPVLFEVTSPLPLQSPPSSLKNTYKSQQVLNIVTMPEAPRPVYKSYPYRYKQSS